MTNEVTAKLADLAPSIYADIQSAVSTGTAFVQAELPETINQLIAWRYVHHITFGVISLIIAILAYRVSKRLWKKMPTCDDGLEVPVGIGGIVTAIASIFGIITVIESVYYICFLYFAPRIYLLDYVKDFVAHSCS